MSADGQFTRNTWHTAVPSALGELTLVRDDEGLRGLYFPHHWYLPEKATFGPLSDRGFSDAVTQIGQYLAGTRREFDLALSPHGDAFQRQVARLE